MRIRIVKIHNSPGGTPCPPLAEYEAVGKDGYPVITMAKY